MDNFPNQLPRSHPQNRRPLVITVVSYLLLLAYGTLYPFSDWHMPAGGILSSLIPAWPEKLHTSDVITNVLIYIPFGLLFALSFRTKRRFWGLVVLTAAAGTGLSFLLEVLQTYLPSRVPSLADVFLNGLGSLLGASLVPLVGQSPGVHHSVYQDKVASLKDHWLKDTPTAQLGLAVLVLWALSQLVPFVPSLDVGNLRDGIRPVWLVVNNIELFDPWRSLVYALNITGLGMLAGTVLRDERHPVLVFALFVTCVLVLKVPIVGRQISVESLLGLAMGMIAILGLRSIRVSVSFAAAFAICLAFFLEVLQSSSSGVTRGISWVPFLGHMNNAMDLADILATVWPFSGLAYLASLSAPPKPKQIAILGGCVVFVVALTVEWFQQYLPGRYPDVTDILLAIIGWTLPWLYISPASKA